MDLSISIVSWNTKDYLKNCLKSIFENTKRIEFEAFVVDNDSSDGSVEMLKEDFPHVSLIRNEKNLGFAGANNLAIRRAKGRNVVIMNSDIFVLPEALKKMVDFLDEHKEAGAVGCKLLSPDEKLNPAFVDRDPNLLDAFLDRILFIHSLKLFLIRKGLLQKIMVQKYSKICEVDFAGGSCLMVKRKAIERIGLMDEDFFMYTEDADWCYRIRKAGWKVYSFPEARVVHYEDQSAKQCNQKMYVQRYLSEFLFYRKHYPFWKGQIYRLIALNGLFIRFMLWGGVYLFIPSMRDSAKNTLSAVQNAFRLICSK